MLSSSFSALRALLLAASLAPSVLSLPAAHPVPHRASHPLSRAALAARDASDYLDSILFINSNETSLFLAIEVGQQTFAAYVDSTWCVFPGLPPRVAARALGANAEPARSSDV